MMNMRPIWLLLARHLKDFFHAVGVISLTPIPSAASTPRVMPYDVPNANALAALLPVLELSRSITATVPGVANSFMV